MALRQPRRGGAEKLFEERTSHLRKFPTRSGCIIYEGVEVTKPFQPQISAGEKFFRVDLRPKESEAIFHLKGDRQLKVPVL